MDVHDESVPAKWPATSLKCACSRPTPQPTSRSDGRAPSPKCAANNSASTRAFALRKKSCSNPEKSMERCTTDS
jgi:hypothetical protein